MSEKRYIGNKYVDCYCSKHANVLVGTDVYIVFNAFAFVVAIVFTILGLFSHINILHKLTLIFLFGIPAIALPFFFYKDAKKTMLKAGHSEGCSRKIAKMVTPRASLWSDFEIMKDKDDGKRVWR